jgi:hypothetical protein
VGIVSSYNPATGTVVVNLTIQITVTDDTGNQSLVSIRPLVDVPVVFIGGGQMVATFPISQGDEALVIFSDRCIDAWWQSGNIQKQAEPRLHDLSDGIAIVGPRSLARLIPNVSTTSAQLRSLDGSTYMEIAPAGKATIAAPGGLTIDANVTITGTITGAGDVRITVAITTTNEGTFNSIPVSTHVNDGVQAGGPNTGPPLP